MIYEGKQKLVQLGPVNESRIFTLETADGRDSIAEQILEDIDQYCAQAYDDGPRAHLGASVIGDECERKIWFGFRWMAFPKFSGRIQRLFNRGHREEERVIEWLTGIGFQIKQVDVDGKQIRIAGVNNHFGGSCDGQTDLPVRYGISGLFPASRMLLEIKTSSDKLFKDIKNSGVIKAKPQHYAQTCSYGRKLGLRYALYVCVNKNDDDIDLEIIELDWKQGEADEAKAQRIIYSTVPPPRLPGANPSFYTCKYCPMTQICWDLKTPVERNCRSCQFAQPAQEGRWGCNAHNQLIPDDFIAKGCDKWHPLPR